MSVVDVRLSVKEKVIPLKSIDLKSVYLLVKNIALPIEIELFSLL